MAQWFAVKARHPDALVFFRMGDFFEMFFADAEAASAALDIALTHRGEHAGAPIAMCGVPVHAADAYLARLIRRGFRVAVAEQMENPKARVGRGPIRREVVRVVTPGTLTEDTLLEARRPNLLLALSADRAGIGAAWLDVSTGLFETEHLAEPELPALLGRLDPAEILAPEAISLGDFASRRAPEAAPSAPLAARRLVSEAFGAASLDAFGTFSDAEAVAAALALDYVRAAGSGTLPRLSHPASRAGAGILAMDAATRASLEIVRARDGGPHALLPAIDRTLTAPGARLLTEWVNAPLSSVPRITDRQDTWAWLIGLPELAARLRAMLRTTPDMERALARLSLGRGTPRDLAALRDGLAACRSAAALLEAADMPGLLMIARLALVVDETLERMLVDSLTDPAPARLEYGGAIRPGFDAELDGERALRDDSRRVLGKLQLDYAQRFGVASLKIRHHAQLGYVIEAPAAAVEPLRGFPDLILRQSMANGARFSTTELAELDHRIAEAAERAAQREQVLFAHLSRLVMVRASAIAEAAAALALVDVAQSAALLAAPGDWCRPKVTEDAAFEVKSGRHPVVERALAGQAAFVPNDCDLSPDRRLLLLTGPNMAGKSTFLRQNALLVVLAQAGLPVPAAAACLGVVDRLFSRVGAADDLARGRSTFMVEMTETAAILNQAGPRSLVVVDEIGRGTATLDGLAIAWAVLEALHGVLRCRTIFATHFHELAELADRMPRLRPHTMRVKEWKRSVVFLHEVAEGAAGRSWGVHVAQLAGVPATVVRRAATLLAALEREGGPLGAARLSALPLFAAAGPGDPGDSPTPGPSGDEALARAVAALDPDRLSPREALDVIYQLKSLLPVPRTEPT